MAQSLPPDLLKVVVVGIGDTSMRDQGIGVHAVEELAKSYILPANVTTVTAAAVNEEVLDALEEATHVIFVDCVMAEEAPGEIFRVPLEEFDRPGEPPESVHEARALEALGVLEMMEQRPAAVLIGVQVADSTPGEGLSPSLAARLPDVVTAIVEELEHLDLWPAPPVADGAGE